MQPFYDRPCADPGLTSYRYKSQFGWIMIGACDYEDALKEAGRSLPKLIVPTINKLEVWNGSVYTSVTP